jgi:ketosteroid isomerase-like protein
MDLSRKAFISVMNGWGEAWNRHDLQKVMELFHDDVMFENWTGALVKGKDKLRSAWEPWFQNHGGFRFLDEDLIIDEPAQKVLYQWRLEWPSMENGFEGKKEVRRGVDVIHFKDGKIVEKRTYSKTTVTIEGNRVRLAAEA